MRGRGSVGERVIRDSKGQKVREGSDEYITVS